MSVISAAGIHVRHAISRALATSNRSPAEATWRVLTARVGLDARGRVAQGEVTLEVLRPEPLGPDLAQRIGVVNPDGNHPLMAVVPDHPGLLMDILPVTWERWLRHHDDVTLPPGIDPSHPRTGVSLEEATAWARTVGKRLPTSEEFRAAWGTGTHPWGDRRDLALGRHEPPRFGELYEVGTHPPGRGGFFDLGAWLWHWTADGLRLGGAPRLMDGGPDAVPCGFRCVQEL